MSDNSTQPSQLLPLLFGDAAPERRLEVLHIGAAGPETVDFFSAFRCRLHVRDLFDELPVPAVEDTERGLEAWFRELLQFTPETRFDICLFWDLFNYLDAGALAAFSAVLEPHLDPSCRAHGFSVHSTRAPERAQRYGIRDDSTVSCRARSRALPGYAPHSQHRLKDLLRPLAVKRSVLLPDGRLELLLQASPGGGTG